MRALPVALLFAVSILAGCSGPAKDGAGGATGPAADPESAGIPLPTWAVGDHWTYAVDGDAATYVVASETTSDWMLATDNEERAFQDLRNDISRLGPQRKSDLAGSQGDDRVEFFHWPLTDGLNWTTTWDQQPVTITAEVQDGLARLEAVDANGSVAYQYTYDPEVRWFGELTHFAPDGTALVTLELTGNGHNWTGETVHWEVDEITRIVGDLASNQPPRGGNFEVPLSATDVWARLAIDCTVGGLLVGVAPLPVVTTIAGVEPRGLGDGGQCPLAVGYAQSAGAPKAPPQGGSTETWSWSANAGPGGTGTYELEVLVRTKVLTPFP